MRRPLVSIIIPLYNSELFIEECVESCLSQQYSPLEIIVIDDGSNDGGYSIVNKIAKSNKNVRLFHTPNNGVSTARNIGIEKANGDYICFIDADDKIDKSFIGTMMSYITSNDADFCFSVNTIGDTNKTETSIIKSNEAETLLLDPRIRVGCWNKIYKKSSLGNTRFRCDLFYGEGLYFINQVAHESRKIVVCSDTLYDYRKVNPESATTRYNAKKMVNGEKALLDIKKIIKEDGPKVNRAWALHYCLFCINAICGISDERLANTKRRVWKKKLLKYSGDALLSNGALKFKVGIIATILSPKFISMTIGHHRKKQSTAQAKGL